MNILFLSTEIPYPVDHGHHLRTANILEMLAKKHHIFFVGFAKDEAELRYKKDLAKICKSADIFILSPGILKWRYWRLALLSVFSNLPFNVKKYYQRDAATKIQALIRQHNIRLVHCDMLHVGIYLPAFHNLSKILTEHNVESLRLQRWQKVEKNPLVRLFLYLQWKKLYCLERQLCSQFDTCIVVSEADKQELLKMGAGNNFEIIPNGVDCCYFAPEGDSVIPKTLIWTGGMDNPYNRDAVDYFLEHILPLVEQEIPDLRVSFVGKSPTPKLLKKAKQDRHIQIEGYVDDVRPHLNRAAVFIAPLRSGSGTKIKILNALAMAKPVVTTSIGAEGIDVTNNYNILISDTPEAFAQQIIYLITHPEVAKIIGRNGRRLMLEKYDWQVIEEKMNRLYDSVGSGAGRPRSFE